MDYDAIYGSKYGSIYNYSDDAIVSFEQFFFFNVDSWVNSHDSRVAGPDVMLKHWLTLNRL